MDSVQANAKDDRRSEDSEKKRARATSRQHCASD